jgi:hypothetical protein
MHAVGITKFDHDHDYILIEDLALDSIRPAPENEKVYRPVSETDPDVMALAASIREHGIKEPLVISADNYILSGHRRHTAARMAGLTTVPCRREKVFHSDPQFLELLREHNRQRIKTLAEVTREEVLSADPEEAYRVLVDHRREQSQIEAAQGTFIIEGCKHRAEISSAKRPFLDAVIRTLDKLRKHWPLSVRQVHYALLNDPPLIHASKPGSRYKNTKESYKAAIDVITRARLAGAVPFSAIDDETRPMQIWDLHTSVASFMRGEMDGFLKGFYRDLLQSQPNQIEVIGEKNTIANIISPVAAEFCAPFTIGRGYSSLPPRQKMAERFRKSGKEKLILLVVSDFDPEGEDIAHSFARSLRDDFFISNIEPIKVCLTRDQVDDMNLPPMMKAKKASSRHDKFVERHGNDVFELEAVPPEELQKILRQSIDSVLDVRAFNAEIEAEKRDAAHLAGVRRAVQQQLQGVDFGPSKN